MKYYYKCVNIQCKQRNEEIVIEKPMAQAGEEEYCQSCEKPLQRIFGSAIKTGDGFKQQAPNSKGK